MKTITTGKTIFLPYRICELTGEVVSETNRSETHVHGHINRNNGGTISSSTTDYQTIYLKDDEGNEHAPTLVDMTIPCREGQRVTLWGINDGWWFEAYNHNTKDGYWNKARIKKYTSPKKFIYVSMAVFALIFSINLMNGGESFMGGIFLGGLASLALGLFLGLFVGLPVHLIRTSHIYNQKKQNMTATG